MKRTLLATAILMTFIASAQAEEFNYSNQNFDQGISVIGDGNKLVADNLNITGSKFFDTPGRNEGIYIAKGASAEFGGDSLNIQFSNQDSSKEFVGIQINAVPSTKTSAIFASKNTVIDVSGPVDSDKWGFGLLVNGFGESSALFSGENVFIKTTTENYTSQSVTVKSGSSIDFSNTENVQIEAYSDYGVTVVDSVRVESDERSGRILFNNEGNVTLIGSVLGNETAQTNVIGMQGWDSLWTVTDKVNEFRISLNGAGVDAVEGSDYSSGTKGIDATGQEMSVTIDSKSFVIDMNVDSNTIDASPEGKTAEKAVGISTSNKANLKVGENTVTHISVNNGIGSAYGISAETGAQVSLLGNTVIDVSGKNSAVAVFVDGSVATRAAAEGAPSVLFEGKQNVINGDIVIQQGSLGFKSGDTTVNGNVSTDANSSMNLSGAAIELKEGNKIIVEGELGSNNGQVVLNEATEGVLAIKTLSQGSSFEAVASSSLNDKLGSDIEAFSKAVNIDNGAEGTKLSMREGLTADAVKGELNKDGSLNKDTVVTTKNTLMQASLELASAAPLALNRIMMNDVRKRLGDIRTSNGTHGAWARYDGGKLSGEGGLENDFHTIQVGIDTVPTADAPRMGVAFSYTDSDAEYARGSADMKAYSLAMYSTWMGDNGQFFDLIGRMGTADTDMVVDGQHKGSMDNVALSMSGEFGWRFDVTNSIYVEPQVEATYTYVNEDSLTLSTANYDVDAVHSLLGRIGFAAGMKCPSDYGNVYVRASAVHEFLGDSKITGVNAGNTNVYEIDGKDTWFEYGIGANFNITKSTYMWADVERTTGGALDEDWRATVGVRYAW